MKVLLSPAPMNPQVTQVTQEQLVDIAIRLMAVGIDCSVGHDFPLGSLVIGGKADDIQVERAQKSIASVTTSRADNLLKALKSIASLWPEPPNCAQINPEWVGENDGKQRAILLEAAINVARAAIALDAL